MKALLPVLLLLLGACAGKAPPEHHTYLLRPPPMGALPESREPVLLQPVVVAPYLDRKGIVLQMSEARIRTARHHEWAEPLDEAVGRYLQVGIANAAGRPVEMSPLTTGSAGVEVRVRIHRLHGDARGEVRLAAEWSVRSPAGGRSLHDFVLDQRQADDGYPALVSAHAEVLDALAQAIAGTLD